MEFLLTSVQLILSWIKMPYLHLPMCYSPFNVDLFTCRSTQATVSMSKSAVFILSVVPWCKKPSLLNIWKLIVHSVWWHVNFIMPNWSLTSWRYALFSCREFQFVNLNYGIFLCIRWLYLLELKLRFYLLIFWSKTWIRNPHHSVETEFQKKLYWMRDTIQCKLI